MKHFLLGLLSIAGATALVTSSGCGGKVFIDLPNGSGGNGGGGGGGGGVNPFSNSASSGLDSSSTGQPPPPMCGCQEFCDVVSSCGVPGPNCQQFCNQVSQDTMACVCKIGANGNCNNLKDCFGGPGPGGGGPGNDLPKQCSDCANKAADTICKNELEACSNNQQCVDILDCHDNCGWSDDCKMQCDGNPGGGGDFFSLMSCIVCQSCTNPCQGTGLLDYCVDSP